MEDGVLQLEGGHLEYWSGDILFVVMVEFRLSGEYPFCGENTQDLLKSVCFTELRFHQKIWDSISGRGTGVNSKRFYFCDRLWARARRCDRVLMSF